MKIKGNCAFYCYGIDGFKKFNNGINNNYNPDLIVMNYGRGKEYVFDKKYAYDLVKAICGMEELEYFGTTKEEFEKEVNHSGLFKVLDYYLKGRGLVMVTGFKSVIEYSNGGQNKVIGITGINLDGNFHVEEIEDLFNKEAKYNEMYKYSSDITF